MTTNSGFNLIGIDDIGETLSGNNTVGVTLASLNLAPLGNYGGPTETLALLPGSVAIGSGSIGTAATPSDQRGFARPNNSPIDVGAFQSSPLVVNTTADSSGADTPGLLTLRQAINLADADTTTTALPITFDTQVFASSQTITLNSGTLTLGSSGIVAPITITGPSAGVTISGADSFTVFTVSGSTTATLSGLTITDGFTKGNGGGIDNLGTLTVSGSTLSGNSASVYGGGIFSQSTLTVINSTLSGNSAQTGGGIAAYGTVTVSGSTLSNDSASDDGGGIAIEATVTVISSTLSNDSASNDGGGIFNFSVGTLTVSGSTLSGNSASGNGGGIANELGASATLNNTIVANSSGGDLYQDTGHSSSFAGSYDLIGDGSESSSFTQVLTGNPLLAPLGNYGGPTQTLALLPGSVAIDAGSNTLIPPGVTTDQRGTGFNRTVNGTVDLGAFESSGFTLSISGGNNQSAVVATAFANPLTVTVTPKNSLEPVAGGRVTLTAPSTGASASFTSANPATIGANRSASVSVTANTTTGGYHVTAAASGAASAVSFSLTNTAAAATHFVVSAPPTPPRAAPSASR